MKGFAYKTANGTYVNDTGNKITNKNAIDFIEKIYIAPAYTDVVIHLDPTDKILYVAKDVKGKSQYFYKPFWHAQSDLKKFCHLADFGRKMPAIRAEIEKELSKTANKKTYLLSPNHLVALQLKIVGMCNFRVGNLIDGNATKSTGISTLKKKHLFPKQGSTTIKFIGKSGMDNNCSIADANVIRALKELAESKSTDDYLFVDKDGKRVDSVQINTFLKSFGNFTSKDFRTWTANCAFIKYILSAEIPETETARKRVLREAVRDVATQLYHTPAICKKKYLYPKLTEDYLKNPAKLIKELRADSKNNGNTTKLPEERAFISYLDRACAAINKKTHV